MPPPSGNVAGGKRSHHAVLQGITKKMQEEAAMRSELATSARHLQKDVDLYGGFLTLVSACYATIKFLGWFHS
jgi:hypothetical protein